MSLRDRGLAIVRDVYIQQPIYSPSELTLQRGFSFRVRVLNGHACASSQFRAVSLLPHLLGMKLHVAMHMVRSLGLFTVPEGKTGMALLLY